LFDGDHLPLHLTEFGGCLFVAADKERGWPKDDDGSCPIGVAPTMTGRQGNSPSEAGYIPSFTL
jgi:hypothetical protein